MVAQAAREVVQGVVAPYSTDVTKAVAVTATASHGDAEEDAVDGARPRERQCATCRQEALLASDCLILDPDDIADWRGNHPPGNCRECSGLPGPAFKVAVKKAQKARAKALGARRNRARNMDWNVLEDRLAEVYPGSAKADRLKLVFSRINLFLATWAAAVASEDNDLK
jgi:hypothetical protein